MAQAENQLIERLARTDRKRLLALCEPVELVLSEVLCGIGESTRHVLFPLHGFISQVTQVPGHDGLEVGMVGREGLLGLQLALGVAASPVRAVVQGAGAAWRLGSVHFARELAGNTALRQAVHRYLYVTLVQLATASACRRFHDIGPRLARWLLMSQDRAHADAFHVTHESMALMLGVRRVGVTVAASSLQAAGLIRYHRGELTVLDRAGLQARACTCYAADREVYRAHMGSPAR
jgi:CRP-like cAMP-binding protein